MISMIRLTFPREPSTDEIDSYFAMRKIALGKDAQGVTRMMLNNKVRFPGRPARSGLLAGRHLHCANRSGPQVRHRGRKKARHYQHGPAKHVKVEPERWYYWADKLGLLVWQDMPARGQQNCRKAKGQFEHELDRMIAEVAANHPSIIMWVVFNEGWGEYDVQRLVEDTSNRASIPRGS